MQHRILKGLRIILLVIVAGAVLGLVTMELWNALLPQIFGWHRIVFWQAFGLLVLSRILFGGFHRHSGDRNRWKRRTKERWEHMTPEEREKFRRGMRCDRNPFAASHSHSDSDSEARTEEQPAEPPR